MSNISLSDILDTIREEQHLDGHITWEDWGDIKISFQTIGGEVPCLSLYMGADKKSDTLYIDIGEDR